MSREAIVPDMDEAERAMALLAATMLMGLTQAFIAAGLDTGEAVKLAAAALLENTFGQKVLPELGLDLSTSYKWRRKMRDAAARIPEDIPDEALGKYVRLAMDAASSARQQ